MKSVTNSVLAMVLMAVFFAGCSKEMDKTPEEINQEVVSLLQQKENSKALKLAERALKQAEKENGAESRPVAIALETAATAYTAAGLGDKAEASYRQALAIINKTDGEDSVEAAKILNSLASLFYVNKNYEESLAHYKKSLEIAEKHLPPDDPRIAAVRNNITSCEALKSGDQPLQKPETKNLPDNIQDLVPAQVKEAAIAQLSKQNIILTGLQPKTPVIIDDKGMIFPYIATRKSEEETKEESKIVVLFAAVRDPSKKDKYIFQQCRVIPFLTYSNIMGSGGIDLLKKELMKIFPDIYS
jgi:tetratricopeptide (TPR) repeat protein